MSYWRENICDQPMTDAEFASIILCNSITISIQWWQKLLKVNKHLCEAPLLFRSVHTSYIYIRSINQFIIGLMDHRLKSLKYLNLGLGDMDQKSHLGIFLCWMVIYDIYLRMFYDFLLGLKKPNFLKFFKNLFHILPNLVLQKCENWRLWKNTVNLSM